MNYSCVAIDDEPLALEKMRGFIERIPFLTLKATFDQPMEALAYLSSNTVDVLFLDIQMESLTGFELLAALPTRPRVILTTAYSEFALKSYEFEVVDYLLKPYSFARFIQAVNKATKGLETHAVQLEPQSDYLFVKVDYKLVKVLLDDILYIEGMRDFRCLHTTNGKLLTQQTFGSFESLLPSTRFQRIHKSYLVSLPHIEIIEKHRVKIANTLLPISETYRDSFYRAIKK
jgi:two-component system, LytTR family, response regulator